MQKGFTLIELMIVVVIIGVLAAIAYPSYRDSVNRTQRADALATLSRLAGAQERFYTRSEPATYSNDFQVLLDDATINSTTIDSDEDLYQVTLANNSCSSSVAGVTLYSCFTLTAQPKAGGGQADDPECWKIVITEVGKSSSTKSGVNNPDGTCW